MLYIIGLVVAFLLLVFAFFVIYHNISKQYRTDEGRKRVKPFLHLIATVLGMIAGLASGAAIKIILYFLR